MAWLWENAVTIANLVMAVAAIAALIYAHLQSSEGRRAAREANAHELRRDYLRLAFDHPKLADPSLHLADFDCDDLTIDGSAELFQKYEWFIGAMLDACVEILDFHADQGMARDIAQPASAPPRLSAFGAFPELGILTAYNAKFQNFVADALAAPAKPPHSGSIRQMKPPKRKATTHA